MNVCLREVREYLCPERVEDKPGFEISQHDVIFDFEFGI